MKELNHYRVVPIHVEKCVLWILADTYAVARSSYTSFKDNTHEYGWTLVGTL